MTVKKYAVCLDTRFSPSSYSRIKDGNNGQSSEAKDNRKLIWGHLLFVFSA